MSLPLLFWDREYFRKQPPLLAIWGRNDPFFIPPGAEAYQRDLPKADVRFLDTGHFALETHAAEIGQAMREFLTPLLVPAACKRYPSVVLIRFS